MMIDGIADAISGVRPVSAKKFIGWRPQYLLGAVLILFLAGAVYAILNTVRSPAPTRMKQVVQQITLLPPPPPPPVEQPPQPEIKEQVAMPEPAPVTKDDAPPPGNLGLDADAGAGSDGFQLQARRGGRSLLDSGGGLGWVRSRIEESIRVALSANRLTRSANFDLIIRVWLNHDGRVERVELERSTGNPMLDKAIKLTAESGSIGNELPPDVPQPVRMKVARR